MDGFILSEPSEAAADALLKYAPHLKRWAHGRLPKAIRASVDIDDLVHDVLLHVISDAGASASLPTLNKGALHAYLRQAVLNRIRDESRTARRQRIPAFAETEQVNPNESPLNQAIDSEQHARYRAALERLGPRDREVVIGRLELGHSYAQIALCSGFDSEDAARIAVSRALRRLISEMGSASLTVSSASRDGTVRRAPSPRDEMLPLGRELKAWLSDCKDLWLRDIVTRRGNCTDVWERVSAWGMYVRLWHRSTTDARELVGRTRQGRVEKLIAAPRRWARNLPKPVVDKIETLAIERASQLEGELVRDDLPWNQAVLTDYFLKVAHARDDLEGVHILLNEVGRAANLVSTLASIDKHGRAFRFNLPVDLQCHDERLERVSLIDPTAWWGSLSFQVPAF
jgi:RNA polymerase sigma-70 factor, ECF subfamily